LQRKKASEKEGVPRGECARIMLQKNCKQPIKSFKFGASFASFLGVCCFLLGVMMKSVLF
jgi:hypothetical protein